MELPVATISQNYVYIFLRLQSASKMSKCPLKRNHLYDTNIVVSEEEEKVSYISSYVWQINFFSKLGT